MLGEGCSEEKGEHNSLPYVPSPCASPNFLSGLPALGGGVPVFHLKIITRATLIGANRLLDTASPASGDSLRHQHLHLFPTATARGQPWSRGRRRAAPARSPGSTAYSSRSFLIFLSLCPQLQTGARPSIRPPPRVLSIP